MTLGSAWGWLRRRCAASPPPSVPPSGCRVRVAGVGVGANDQWICSTGCPRAFFVGRSDMGPKWTCATSASWESETPTPLILGRPTWPLLPSGLPSPPWLQTSMGIAPPMLHHGSHGIASKLFAPKGRTPWASTPICGMGRPWRLLCVWGLSRGVSFGWRVVAC